MNDRLMTAEEVAAKLAVPTSWVRAETRAGRMPHVKLGRYRRYAMPIVAAWIVDQQSESGRWRKHRPSLPPDKALQWGQRD